jgi:hemolysin III
MLTRERVPMVYSRAELLSDAAVHVTGIVAALLAVPVLITLAAVWVGEATVVVAALVYGLSLIGMLACSAVNNMVRLPAWKDLLRRIDQSAIYLKIAGSYTPFAVLAGTHAGLFLAGLWGAAIAGAAMRLWSAARLKWASIVLYLLIGWVGAVAGGPLFAEMSPAGFALILVAGGIYTLGVVFFVWERLPFHNTIWHAFVLAASFVLYAAVLVEIAGRAA